LKEILDCIKLLFILYSEIIKNSFEMVFIYGNMIWVLMLAFLKGENMEI